MQSVSTGDMAVMVIFSSPRRRLAPTSRRQNRYKSILCEEDIYLKELVRYIHLNPLRAKMVGNLDELGAYAYSGHSVLMGEQKRDFQDRDFILGLFGKRERDAKKRYLLSLLQNGWLGL